MSPTGPFYAGSAVSASGANGAWTNPSNATGAPDAVYASGNISGAGSQTNSLQLTNFGFNIPSTAIIDGIYVEFDRYGVNAETNSIQLLAAGSGAGTIHGAQNGSGGYADVWPPSSESFVGYGGSSDLWGAAWTPSQINNSSFGVAIQVLNTHGGGTAFIDAVRITVYWHTAPIAIPQQKYYLYKVFDSQSGAYMGNLPKPSSDFIITQDINTAGAQITVIVPVAADTSAQSTSILTDDNGNALTDENNNTLTDDGVQPPTGIGTSGALIRDGNRIQVWEYGYYHPNGICMFRGIIERHEDNFGGDTGDESVRILVYSDGQDLDKFMILSQPNADQSQTTVNSTYLLNFASNSPALGQSITPGTGVTGVARIRLQMAAVKNNSPIVTMSLYASRAGVTNLSRSLSSATPDATALQVISSTTAQTYDFIFQYTFPAGFSGYYTIMLSCTDIQGVNVSYQNTAIYGGGTIISPTVSTGDLYFITYNNSASTNPLYSTIDPSNMLLSVIGNYGGRITASPLTVQATGLTIPSYQFNTSTVYSGIQNILTLAPNGFYYYVDLGQNLMYFQRANTNADFVLTKGVHINKLTVVSTIEYVTNAVYMIGGPDPNSPATPKLSIYTFDSDAASIALYGQRAQIHTDSHIIDAGTAHIVGQNIIAANKYEQYQTTVTVLDKTMDTTLLVPGKIIGFNGFGTYVDGLLAQIVHRDYSPDSVTLQLGILPKRISVTVERVVRGLVALSTVNNAPAPS